MLLDINTCAQVSMQQLDDCVDHDTNTETSECAVKQFAGTIEIILEYARVDEWRYDKAEESICESTNRAQHAAKVRRSDGDDDVGEHD